jgi:aspartate dehydrogenase
MGLAGHFVRSVPATCLAGRVFTTLEDLLATTPRVVVEAASHEAVREFAVPVLRSGADFVCLSVGALANPILRAQIEAAAASTGARLLISSGAVGALDLLSAAAELGLDEVVVEQRKPPASLLPMSDAHAVTEPRVVFDGSVKDVVDLYPKTTNVAAAVALAGVGFDATRAVVIADPTLSANRASITATGAFGSFTLRLDNVATANPLTSAIVAASVLATLRRLVGRVVVPA